MAENRRRAPRAIGFTSALLVTAIGAYLSFYLINRYNENKARSRTAKLLDTAGRELEDIQNYTFDIVNWKNGSSVRARAPDDSYLSLMGPNNVATILTASDVVDRMSQDIVQLTHRSLQNLNFIHKHLQRTYNKASPNIVENLYTYINEIEFLQVMLKIQTRSLLQNVTGQERKELLINAVRNFKPQSGTLTDLPD